jgi:large subunit ribosomal protein L25
MAYHDERTDKMQNVKLKAKVRDTSSKSNLKQLRKSGRVAASVYGHGRDSISVSIDLAELIAAVKGEAGAHALMELAVEDAPKEASGVVVIKQMAKDPISRQLLHVDFQRVLMTEKLITEVTIELVGTAIGIQQGGLLEHVMRSLNVRCLPGVIPSSLEVDVSGIEVGHSLHVSDLPLPEGVEPMAQPDEVVVAVRQPTVRVEVAAATATE